MDKTGDGGDGEWFDGDETTATSTPSCETINSTATPSPSSKPCWPNTTTAVTLPCPDMF